MRRRNSKAQFSPENRVNEVTVTVSLPIYALQNALCAQEEQTRKRGHYKLDTVKNGKAKITTWKRGGLKMEMKLTHTDLMYNSTETILQSLGNVIKEYKKAHQQESTLFSLFDESFFTDVA